MMQFSYNFNVTCLNVFTVFIVIFFKKQRKVKSKLFAF